MKIDNYPKARKRIDDLPLPPKYLSSTISAFVVYPLMGVAFIIGGISSLSDVSLYTFGFFAIGAFTLYEVISNLKSRQLARKSWEKVSDQDYQIINQEASNALQIGTALVTSVGIIDRSPFGLSFIPLKDILWVFGNNITEKYNGIKSDKVYEIVVSTCDSRQTIISLGKKRLNDENPINKALGELHSFITSRYPRVVFGYTKEIDNIYHHDIQKMTNFVNSKNKTESSPIELNEEEKNSTNNNFIIK